MNKEPLHISDDLIVAFLNGDATNEQSRMIQHWIAESPVNKKRVDDVHLIWTEAGKLDPKPIAVDVDKAWDSVFARMEKTDEKPLTRKTIPLFKTVLKIAAVIVPAFFVTYFYLHSHKEIKQLATVTTNKTLVKKLEDGSEITINVHSKFEYPETFNDATREVSLQGEAFFSVAPNKAKPFIIHSNAVSIKVVGTSFNVKTSKDCVEVLVKTGKVLLYSVLKSTGDTVSVVLIPGNKAVYFRTSNTIIKEESSNENDMFWMTKTMVFNKTELSEVIAVLKKNYGVSIELKDQKFSTLRLTASFSNQSLESILEIIATSLTVEITKTPSSFVIHEKGN